MDKIMLIDQQADKSKALLFKMTGKIGDAALRAKLRGSNVNVSKIEDLKDSSFAYAEKRLFPVDTKANTLLSMVYFANQQAILPAGKVPGIKKSLEVHAKLHNIQVTLASLKAKAPSVTKAASDKSALPTPRYLLPEHEFCKVANSEDLAKAQQLFDREFTELQLADRVTFSTNFIKAAQDFSAPITSEHIEKYAGVLDYNASHTQHALELRMGMASMRGESSDTYHKLAAELEGLTEKPTQEELLKLASTVEDIDKMSSITERDYDTKIHSPQGVVFCKAAEESSEATEGKSEELTKADIIGKYGEDALESVEAPDGSIDKNALLNVQRLGGGRGNVNNK